MSGLNEWQKHPDALHVISLGAGRQSSAMYLMAVAGAEVPEPRLGAPALPAGVPAAADLVVRAHPAGVATDRLTCRSTGLAPQVHAP